MPTAEIRVDAIADAETRLAILREEENRPAHPAVFGVVPRHELRFGLGKVEGRPVQFGDGGDEEDEEADGLQGMYQTLSCLAPGRRPGG